jgi:hypothetical protein
LPAIASDTAALAETLRALAAVLDGQRLGWFAFGAQAVAARGAPRATQDVDPASARSHGARMGAGAVSSAV